MVTTSICCPWQQLIVSMVTVSKLVAPGNFYLFHSDGHFCFLSYRQILYIDLYRSIITSELACNGDRSVVTVFVSLFAYLFVSLNL